MQNDCATVDRLIEEIVDYNSRYQEVAVAKLKQLCSQSYEAYAYLYVRVLNESLPANAQRRLDDVLTTVRKLAHVFYGCGRMTPRIARHEERSLSENSRYSFRAVLKDD
ncbi:MAG: hypothetical protein ACXV3U_06950 [Halobacteriota archaeon]